MHRDTASMFLENTPLSVSEGRLALLSRFLSLSLSKQLLSQYSTQINNYILNGIPAFSANLEKLKVRKNIVHRKYNLEPRYK